MCVCVVGRERELSWQRGGGEERDGAEEALGFASRLQLGVVILPVRGARRSKGCKAVKE